jgi:hypothetical protein
LEDIEAVLKEIEKEELIKKSPFGPPVVLGEWIGDDLEDDDESSPNVSPNESKGKPRVAKRNEGRSL